MTTFISPDGEKFEIDATIPQAAAFVRQNKLRPVGDDQAALRDLLKSSISGITEGVARVPFFGGDLAKLGMTGINAVRPDTFSPETVGRFGSQGWIDAFKGSAKGFPEVKSVWDPLFHLLPSDETLKKGGLDATYEPQTKEGRYTKAGTSALAGGVATGGIGSIGGPLSAAKVALSPASMAINTGAGLASEAAMDVTRDFDDTKQGNPLVGLVAGIGTAGVGNLVRQGFKSNYPQDVYNATKTMKPEDWDSAGKSLRDFQASGSKTYTLADLPELQSRLGGPAQGLSNTAGGDLLRQRLSLQERTNKDIPALIESALPPGGGRDPRELVQALVSRSDKIVGDAKAPIYGARDAGLAAIGDLDPARLVAAGNRYIRKPSFLGENQGVGRQAALKKAEALLLGKDAPNQPLASNIMPPVLDPQALSQNVKSLRRPPTTETDSAGANISRLDQMKAADAAEKALDRATRGKFSQVMDQYGQSKAAIIEPLERGLVGTLRDAKNPEGVISRLRAVPPDRLLGELNTAQISRAEAAELARIIGAKLSPIPSIPGNQAALADRQLFNTLLEYVSPDMAKGAANKLSVADALSRLKSEHGTDMTQRLNQSKSPMDWLNPLGTAGFRNRLRVGEREASQLSELLANPNAENLAKLRELSKVDPRARRALEFLSGWGAAGATSALDGRPASE